MNGQKVAKELLAVARELTCACLTPRRLTAGYSSDSDKWFDLVVDDMEAGQREPRLVKVVSFAPTRGSLEKLKTELGRVRTGWSRLVQRFIEKMEAGEYDREFKIFEGSHIQISELFSFLKQALTYHN